VTILLLSLARLAWRLANPPPPMPATLAPWERRLAGATHFAFYVIIIGMPLTGWIMVSSSKLQIPTVLYGLVPWPHIPGLAGLADSARNIWNNAGFAGHLILGYTLMALLPLHVAGALKHQLFSRDEPVLARMAPGARPGRWLEPRLLAIVLSAIGAAILGLTLTPPRPGVAPPAAGAVTAATASLTSLAPRWTVEPGSNLSFSTTWGERPIEGRFRRWKAEIAFDPAAPERSQAWVEIDLASVSTGDAQRDATLVTSDWLDAAAHPTAAFTADRFEQTGPEAFVAGGRLVLRGVNRPLDLPFRLELDGDQAHAVGTASIDRTAFGVGRGESAGTAQLPAAVQVKIDLRATRAGP